MEQRLPEGSRRLLPACLLLPLEEETEHFVMADHYRLQQVLLNLLNNGVKYSAAGGSVMLECRCEGETVRLAIHDNGVRIAPEMLARAFTPFAKPL